MAAKISGSVCSIRIFLEYMAGLKGWFLAQPKCCKPQNGKGCPGERLKPCAPLIIGQGARSPVVVSGAKPTNIHVRGWPAYVSVGQAPIASCAQSECSLGAALNHHEKLNLAVRFFTGWPVLAALVRP
jgi:hypothetical protein